VFGNTVFLGDLKINADPKPLKKTTRVGCKKCWEDKAKMWE
jgi:hypothetical protein